MLAIESLRGGSTMAVAALERLAAFVPVDDLLQEAQLAAPSVADRIRAWSPWLSMAERALLVWLAAELAGRPSARVSIGDLLGAGGRPAFTSSRRGAQLARDGLVRKRVLVVVQPGRGRRAPEVAIDWDWRPLDLPRATGAARAD